MEKKGVEEKGEDSILPNPTKNNKKEVGGAVTVTDVRLKKAIKEIANINKNGGAVCPECKIFSKNMLMGTGSDCYHIKCRGCVASLIKNLACLQCSQRDSNVVLLE